MSLIERLDRALKRALLELPERPVASALECIGTDGGLFPNEAALISGALDRRRKEFSAGRRCARRALASLGCRPEPLLTGSLREPIWPSGFSGSISHDGRFAAALAYSSVVGRVWLSIDLIDRPDPEVFIEIVDTIFHPAEPCRCSFDARAIARLFSAKEAAIKIISPYVGSLVDFRQLNATETELGFHVVAEDARIEISVRSFEVDDVIVSLGWWRAADSFRSEMRSQLALPSR
jgi:4'-phosphopantetheinyl transferase EntD